VGASLHLAGTYRRHVTASLERIWQNVFDWEHLGHLHASSFARCVLLDSGPWGWRARLGLVGRDPCADTVIELIADRAAGRYVTTTLEGEGTGTEIRVALTERSAHAVDVEVQFHVAEDDPERLARIGAGYAQAYARLWDEDEAMMHAREAALAHTAAEPRTSGGRIDLGASSDVRAALPLAFTLSGRDYRLVEQDGALVAHSTLCPHWLGPLGHSDVVDGAVTCPWHGYRFDIRSRRCLDAPGLKLARAPRIEEYAGRVWACWS
jgi:nitrite reductase/ring-hydroxylating ferredoxin subunit